MPKRPIKNGKIREVKRNLYGRKKAVVGKSLLGYLNQMKQFESDGYYRENMWGSELIWNGTRIFILRSPFLKTRKYMWIFGMVSKDARKYLLENGTPDAKWIPATHRNKKITSLRNKVLAGVDLDDAYWNMAYRLGIIRENTYRKGLKIPDTFKALRLSALSSLGKNTRYSEIKNGEQTNNSTVVKGNDDLKQVYRLIRFECFKYMRKLARELKDQYVLYRTDGLFYFYNQHNTQIVRDFMDKHGLDYKLGMKRTRGGEKAIKKHNERKGIDYQVERLDNKER